MLASVWTFVSNTSSSKLTSVASIEISSWYRCVTRNISVLFFELSLTCQTLLHCVYKLLLRHLMKNNRLRKCIRSEKAQAGKKQIKAILFLSESICKILNLNLHINCEIQFCNWNMGVQKQSFLKSCRHFFVFKIYGWVYIFIRNILVEICIFLAWAMR